MLSKMEFSEVRWWGGWGAGMTTMLFLRMTLDHDGWMLGFDLFFAAGWLLILVRFIRLKTIIIKCDDVVIRYGDQP